MPLTGSASTPGRPESAVVGPATARATLTVKGMTCAACQSFVQRTLETHAGVRGAVVNLMMENATVEYDPLLVSPQQLAAAINSTGYEASLPPPGRSATADEEQQDRDQQAAYERLRRETAWTLVAAAVAMALSMPLMQHGSLDPLLHRVAMALDAPFRALAPWLYEVPAEGLRWTLLVLSAGVMALTGRRFYVKAWAAARHRTTDMNTLIAAGTGAAFLYSAAVTVAPRLFETRGVPAEVYFEAVVFILALVLAGNTMEARSRRRAARKRGSSRSTPAMPCARRSSDRPSPRQRGPSGQAVPPGRKLDESYASGASDSGSARFRTDASPLPASGGNGESLSRPATQPRSEPHCSATRFSGFSFSS